MDLSKAPALNIPANPETDSMSDSWVANAMKFFIHSRTLLIPALIDIRWVPLRNRFKTGGITVAGCCRFTGLLEE